MNTFKNVLAGNKILVCDGAMGTFLHQQGLKPGECPELWCVERAEDVKKIHRAYREAGSHLVECNSFGGSRCKLAEYGLGDRVSEINQAAAALAKAVAGPDQFVLGSIGPTGEFMEPLGDLEEAEIIEIFREQAVAMEAGGTDVVIVETMTALEEALAAVRAVKDYTQMAVIASFTFDPLMKGGYATMMGLRPAAAATAVREAGADMVGSNCGLGPEHLLQVLREMNEAEPGFSLLAMPNAGMPVFENGSTVFKESPEDMADYVPELLAAGVRILGGCCGTTPAHISALRAAVPAELLFS